MAAYTYLVITNPVPGREAEYNDWYDRQHLADVLRVPGFVAAQRFKVSGENALPGRYVAIYELETDDPQATIAALEARAGSPEMPLSEALDLTSVSATLTEPLGNRRTR